MLFSIYYLNFSKVYEMKMMLSNLIKTDQTIETGQSDEMNAEIQAKMGTKFLKIFNADVAGNVSGSNSDSQKVLETFKVTTTKSLLLSEVLGRCKTFDASEQILEGTLLNVKDVNLSLENNTELRTVKMLSNGMLKGLSVPEMGGLDINNLFNSMFKDYAYKICGKTSSGIKILIKIPLTFENEFENLYNVDDLFVGKVSVIGIYKGIIRKSAIKNSIDYFQENRNDNYSDTDDEIHSSQDSSNENGNTENDDKYHYLDLLAIIQEVRAYDDGKN